MNKNNLKYTIIENRIKGINVCKIYFDNKIFKGKSKCKKDDFKYYSPILGGKLAHMRAYIKLLEYLINNTSSEKEKERYNADKQYLIKGIEDNIDNFYSIKKRVDKFKERKEKGILSAKQEFQQKIDELLKLKK